MSHLVFDHIVAVARPDNIVSRWVMDRVGLKYVKMAYYYHAEVVYYAICREEYPAASRSKSAASTEPLKSHGESGGLGRAIGKFAGDISDPETIRIRIKGDFEPG